MDGRVFRVKVGEDVGSVKAVTPGKYQVWCFSIRIRLTLTGYLSYPSVPDTESSVYRYADFAVHPQNPDLVLAIREDHTIDEPSKVVNALVVINAANKEVTVVVEGNDFYASPRWNNDGTKAAWIEVSRLVRDRSLIKSVALNRVGLDSGLTRTCLGKARRFTMPPSSSKTNPS